MVRGSEVRAAHENSLSAAVREDVSRAILARIDNGLCRALRNWSRLVCEEALPRED